MHVYILNQEKTFFSVYIDQKTIVVSSTDKTKLQEFKKVVEHHHRVSGKWLNLSHSYSYTTSSRKRHELKLQPSTLQYSSSIRDNWDIVELDMYKNSDCNLIDLMYECSNIRLFLLQDFEFHDDIPLLCINGVLLEKPSEIPRYNPVIFLNALRDLNL